MTKHRVEYDRPNCIGAGACAAAHPERWVMNYDKDGKADLVGSTEGGDGKHYLEISDEELKQMLEAAEICPVNVIHILKNRKEKII